MIVSRKANIDHAGNVQEGRAAPVQRGDRLIALDLIRGIAVLGILLANITGFAHVDIAYYWPPALASGANEGDTYVWLAQFVLVDGKFRGLFSILFGAGMVLFMDKAGSHQDATVLQVRRLFWLMLFGLAHFFLLFNGDILFSYGCAGLFALFAVPLKPRTQLSVGIIWGLGGALLQALPYVPAVMAEAGVGSGTDLAYYSEYWNGQLAKSALEGQLMAGDSYLAILQYRFFDESDVLSYYFALGFFETIPLMMIGMGLFRMGVFNPADDAPHWRGMALAALALGAGLNLVIGLYVFSNGFAPYTTQFAFFGLSPLANIPMLVGGTCLLAPWAARAGEGWLAERLATAGRMAFSNYIGTSLVMVLIFQGWAGGLYGTLHRLELLLVVALGWALMIVFSRVWLARFRQGPLEYIWRCLTYWRIFPNRL